MKKNVFIGIGLSIFAFMGLAVAADLSGIAGHWAEDNLMWAVDHGLLQGDGETGALRPDDGVTRSEMVTILKRYDALQQADDLFSKTVDGITWIGREVMNDVGDTVYQALKIDEDGTSTVFYENSHLVYHNVEWNFASDEKSFVLKEVNAAPEAAAVTEIGFVGGEEVIRSERSEYGERVAKGLNFTLPGSLTFFVRLNTTGDCKGLADDVPVQQTELFGVTISSEEGAQNFDLDVPVMIDCTVYDSGFFNPNPYNVVTTIDGISFDMPNGQSAFVSTAEGAENISVVF